MISRISNNYYNNNISFGIYKSHHRAVQSPIQRQIKKFMNSLDGSDYDMFCRNEVEAENAVQGFNDNYLFSKMNEKKNLKEFKNSRELMYGVLSNLSSLCTIPNVRSMDNTVKMGDYTVCYAQDIKNDDMFTTVTQEPKYIAKVREKDKKGRISRADIIDFKAEFVAKNLATYPDGAITCDSISALDSKNDNLYNFKFIKAINKPFTAQYLEMSPDKNTISASSITFFDIDSGGEITGYTTYSNPVIKFINSREFTLEAKNALCVKNIGDKKMFTQIFSQECSEHYYNYPVKSHSSRFLIVQKGNTKPKVELDYSVYTRADGTISENYTKPAQDINVRFDDV